MHGNASNFVVVEARELGLICPNSEETPTLRPESPPESYQRKVPALADWEAEPPALPPQLLQGIMTDPSGSDHDHGMTDPAALPDPRSATGCALLVFHPPPQTLSNNLVLSRG